MHSNDTTPVVKRPLTAAEMQTLLTAVSNATSTADLLTVAVLDLFTILLADEGKTVADFTSTDRLARFTTPFQPSSGPRCRRRSPTGPRSGAPGPNWPCDWSPRCPPPTTTPPPRYR